MNIKPKNKPKFYEIRKWLCKWLVNLARWVEPRSEEVSAFYLQQMMDMMIVGQTITRIDPFNTTFDFPTDERTVN